ncbi:hypothetical protein SAMN05216319_0325 [Duganella sp. CF402]|uniref:hypothetical protein n=1 Tax=unclassified Duganella TaxID=2636909 RepID=UPI0008CA9568|nr:MULTISPECIES: hypothetical protein [unclassified Duganella]RZT11196.1 hypothetical protein EV582_3301 [Duganella sp. BK701]SEK76807.1 hypothetical protein SAMN05216319_0325 [Duganella sp. CF402]
MTISDPLTVGSLAGMTGALVVGDHIVVRSRSDSFVTVNSRPKYAGTRLSVLDKQGKLVSTTDYGFTLAEGYTGEWLMLPSPDGFVMVQASTGTRLLHFDAQARLLGSSTDLYPPVAATSTTEYAAAENGGAVDGNGFWLATTFSLLPVTDKTQYVLKLCKFDFNGRQLTPPFTISTSALHPRVAASNGTVLAGWMEGGGATLAMWAKGAGAPTIRSINTGGSQPYPVALNSSGKMAVLWNGKATTTSSGGVMGVAVDSNGAAVLATGRTDLTQESLSSNWNGNPRATEIDAHVFSGGLTIAGSVVGAFRAGDPVGDVLVLADYGVSSGPLSSQAQSVDRFTLPGRALLGTSPVFRQMLFADHAVLLVGDDERLRAFNITRTP